MFGCWGAGCPAVHAIALVKEHARCRMKLEGLWERSRGNPRSEGELHSLPFLYSTG